MAGRQAGRQARLLEPTICCDHLHIKLGARATYLKSVLITEIKLFKCALKFAFLNSKREAGDSHTATLSGTAHLGH